MGALLLIKRSAFQDSMAPISAEGELRKEEPGFAHGNLEMAFPPLQLFRLQMMPGSTEF